jgi:hypothetical protein
MLSFEDSDDSFIFLPFIACLCRRCAGLYYESTSINRHSVVGALKYRLTRKFKIVELQAQVKRVSYKGKFTRRARRVMSLVGAVGG